MFLLGLNKLVNIAKNIENKAKLPLSNNLIILTIHKLYRLQYSVSS